MVRPKRWMIAEPHPGAAELAGKLKISPLIAQILLNRGIQQPDEARAFLSPSLSGLADPNLLPGISIAAGRIARAIAEKEKIVVYGDYDVDGITATSILWHVLKLLGAEVATYIPHRIDEGYGINAEAIRQIINEGARLIITVDCGITAVEGAAIAREKGVDFIVTDHHEWHCDESGKPVLPDCTAIVHPRLPGGAYPNPHLCGAGVAFKLAWAIGQAVSGTSRVSQPIRDFLLEATALAGLGTIADVVPLVGENRILAFFGLGGLKESRLLGIRALIASASLEGRKLNSYHVGFLLAPRLNACGRLGHARLAVEMLTCADEVRANEIAAYLESQNRSRQAMEKQIFQQAVEQVETNGWDQRERGLVLAAEGWHAGVIGIVASRIVERFSRPTVMVALNNGHGQGSGRSISGFHLARALAECSSCLNSYGGHEMAAGLKLDTSKLDDFRRVFCDYAGLNVTEEMLTPRLRIDCKAELGQFTFELTKELERLGPFGHANPRPLLCVEGVTMAGNPRRVGKTGEHLQLTVRQGQSLMRGIAFNWGSHAEKLPSGTAVDLAVEPNLNEYNGRVSVELNVKDIACL